MQESKHKKEIIFFLRDDVVHGSIESSDVSLVHTPHEAGGNKQEDAVSLFVKDESILNHGEFSLTALIFSTVKVEAEK